LPTSFGSVYNTFSYRNLSLYINITYKYNYNFVRSSISYSELYNNGRGHSDFALRWHNPGDENRTTVPAMIYPAAATRDEFYSNSSVLVERGDHIRLQDISLSYQFLPQGWLKQARFSN